MKKLFRTMVLALVMMCSAVANAQDSQNFCGVNFGYGVGNYDFSNVGIGIKYGHFLSESLRLEASGMYYFKSGNPSLKNLSKSTAEAFKGDEGFTTGKATDWLEVNLNAHYLFNVAERTYFYPIFGFTTMWGKTSFDWKDVKELNGKGFEGSYKDTHFRFGVNLGVGGQYNVTEDFGITLEAKYKLVNSNNKFGHFGIALGCAVLF